MIITFNIHGAHVHTFVKDYTCLFLVLVLYVSKGTCMYLRDIVSGEPEQVVTLSQVSAQL